jgi:hypothetical protein
MTFDERSYTMTKEVTFIGRVFHGSPDLAEGAEGAATHVTEVVLGKYKRGTRGWNRANTLAMKKLMELFPDAEGWEVGSEEGGSWRV